jgi:hypothetical protein
LCDSERTGSIGLLSNVEPTTQAESDMYIGGGLLGTVLVVLLIIYLVRRV